MKEDFRSDPDEIILHVPLFWGWGRIWIKCWMFQITHGIVEMFTKNPPVLLLAPTGALYALVRKDSRSTRQTVFWNFHNKCSISRKRDLCKSIQGSCSNTTSCGTARGTARTARLTLHWTLHCSNCIAQCTEQGVAHSIQGDQKRQSHVISFWQI